MANTARNCLRRQAGSRPLQLLFATCLPRCDARFSRRMFPVPAVRSDRRSPKGRPPSRPPITYDPSLHDRPWSKKRNVIRSRSCTPEGAGFVKGSDLRHDVRRQHPYPALSYLGVGLRRPETVPDRAACRPVDPRHFGPAPPIARHNREPVAPELRLPQEAQQTSQRPPQRSRARSKTMFKLLLAKVHYAR